MSFRFVRRQNVQILVNAGVEVKVRQLQQQLWSIDFEIPFNCIQTSNLIYIISYYTFQKIRFIFLLNIAEYIKENIYYLNIDYSK